jgi:hypothetical protein
MRRLVVVAAALLVCTVAVPAGASDAAVKPKPICAGAESLTIIGPISHEFDAASRKTLASLGRQLRSVHLSGFNTGRLASRVTKSLGQGYADQLAAITAVANACLTDHVIKAPTTPTTPTTSPESSVTTTLPSGIYTDGPQGTPHYFITLTSQADGSLNGTVTFLAQDGNTPTAFTFTGTTQSGVATLTPSTGSAITAPFTNGQITLGGCTNYLQFAQSNADCTFNFSPNGLM